MLDNAVSDAILESNFLSGGLSAEYGDASLLATITRSGANELTGSLRGTVGEEGEARLRTYQFSAGLRF